MIGFWVVNLLVPEEPQTLSIKTASGTWTLEKAEFYTKSLEGILNNKCAHTYTIEHPVSMKSGAAACDIAFDEITPLLLGASYLSGLSVTVKQSLTFSDVTIINPTAHWPRERSIGSGYPIISTSAEFVTAIEAFLQAWPDVGQRQKVCLLVHHWLDALACWSFEDLYLSATTLLQIIAATEEDFQGKSLSYLDAVSTASTRAGITPLTRDFKDMRNNLIHEGRLLGGKFPGKTLDDCAVVAADVLNWFDSYMHSALKLGAVCRKRFSAGDFLNLNSYSISD